MRFSTRAAMGDILSSPHHPSLSGILPLIVSSCSFGSPALIANFLSCYLFSPPLSQFFSLYFLSLLPRAPLLCLPFPCSAFLSSGGSLERVFGYTLKVIPPQRTL